MKNSIIVTGVKEGNLKNISVEIPRNKLVVLTGLSGSGKTTLAMDVIYQECQRQYLEAISFQGIRRPDIEYLKGASPAVCITQTSCNKNPRSSVGTLTDIYTDLRMIYEKLGKRTCPYCGKEILASSCVEEAVKDKDEFTVFMYCSECGGKMKKLTRTFFSYNTREGACPKCEGMGKIISVEEERILHKELSLEEGAVDFWEQKYKEYQIEVLYAAFFHYNLFFQPNMPVEKFTEMQKYILFYGVDNETVRQAFPDIQMPRTVADGRFEGIYNTMMRRVAEKGSDAGKLGKYLSEKPCQKCHGERLGRESRKVSVMGMRLPQLSGLTMEELSEWLGELDNSLDDVQRPLVEVYLEDLRTKITRIINVGLEYLTMDRQAMTLSGGEAQRIKLAAVLDSELTGIIYVLDEPTAGLHPRDTAGLIRILKDLCGLGNTVIVIEHDTDIMEAADYVIDMGPGAGKYGGQIVGCGTLEQLKNQEESITGNYLRREAEKCRNVRTGDGGSIKIEHASMFNLRDITVSIPTGKLVSVTGVSGSGKSTLIFEILAKYPGQRAGGSCCITGLEKFDSVITIEQSPLTRMKRSNVATFSGLYDKIRKIFGSLPEAKKKGFTAKEFSFNIKGGRCETCEGLGTVASNMLFFPDTEAVCPVCHGRRFRDEVLEIQFKGYSIRDVLQLSVREALEVFKEYPGIIKILRMLMETGLGYLELGQTLTTLSGGEGQRLKLASELLGRSREKNLYLIDEPTTGLHPIDVENFLVLLNKIADAGNTVVVVEHNLQVIRNSDWIIDLGPGGGIHGGRVIAWGTPSDIMENESSATGRALACN